MDALLPRLPSIAGWGLAWLIVCVAVLLVRRRSRVAPLLVVHAAVAVPVATLLSGGLRGALGLGEVVDAGLIGLGLHLAAVVLAGRGYGIILGAAEQDEAERRARSGRPVSWPKPRRLRDLESEPPPHALVSVADLKPAAPRPVGAVGTVAARGLGRAAAAEEESRGRALLAMLDSGSDVHRAAACRALAVPYAGRRDARVGRALLDVIDDVEGDQNVRAEAAITLGLVFGREVSDAESLRGSFEASLDDDWLAAVRGEVG